jgi:alkanesulfonate monooxygenase SsuD/methylene tetrahydromethanopterin reductase-like flavin-dependent oxidoreductase (luciferase family)
MNDVTDRQLRFGIFDHMDDAGIGMARQFADRLDLAELCDRSGFFCYHLAEHHCTPHGMAASPNLFLSSLAQRTTRIRLGPLLMLLAFYHPLRAYEEICLLDQLSGGRLELGIGRGSSAFELKYYGIEPDEDRYRESADILFKAMNSDRLSHRGPLFSLQDVPVALKPLQRPHPPLWYGATRPEAAAIVAEEGANMASFGTVASVRAVTDAFRRRWRDSGHDSGCVPFIGMTRHIVIAPTKGEVLELAKSAYCSWSATYSDLWTRRGLAVPSAVPRTFEHACEAGVCLVGTPSTVRQAVRDQVSLPGSTISCARSRLATSRSAHRPERFGSSRMKSCPASRMSPPLAETR